MRSCSLPAAWMRSGASTVGTAKFQESCRGGACSVNFGALQFDSAVYVPFQPMAGIACYLIVVVLE
jgi:hypothetical protein